MDSGAVYSLEEGPDTAGPEEVGTESVLVPTELAELMLSYPLEAGNPDVGTASGAVLLGEDGEEAPLDGRAVEPG